MKIIFDRCDAKCENGLRVGAWGGGLGLRVGAWGGGVTAKKIELN